MADGDYGIAIGIDRYPAFKPPLEGAVADATAFHNWLVDPRRGGVPPEQARLITSNRRGAARPVHDEIDDSLDRFLEEAARRGARRLYVYFAGHGYSVRQDHVNLLLANATGRLLNRGLDASQYRQVLSGGPFREQVFLYDCCRTFDARTLPVGLSPGFPAHVPAEGETPPAVKQLTLYAVLLGSRSAERTDAGGNVRGLFSRLLLEGLDGGAAIRHADRHRVTDASLRAFLNSRLRHAALAEGVLQSTSVHDVGPDQKLVLADPATPWLMSVRLRTQRVETRAVIVNGNGGLHERANVRDGVALFELPPGIYAAASEPPGEALNISVEPAEPLEEVLEVEAT